MKITIECGSKEITALVQAIQKLSNPVVYSTEKAAGAVCNGIIENFAEVKTR